jgi:hypothetical protein
MGADINLGLTLLNALLGWIGQLRAQNGITDDALAAQAGAITKGNDDAYAAMMAALKLQIVPATPPAAAPTTTPSA